MEQLPTHRQIDLEAEQDMRLKDRMNPHQLQKRTEKIAARRTAHEQLQSEQRRFMLGVAQAFNSYFKRGIFGRFKWLVFGK